jgi:hypothetical protein
MDDLQTHRNAPEIEYAKMWRTFARPVTFFDLRENFFAIETREFLRPRLLALRAHAAFEPRSVLLGAIAVSSFEKSCRFIFVRRMSMAFGMYFRPTGFTPAVYDDVIKQLEQAGAGIGKVPGRRFHCAMEVEGAVSVFDVWDSMEQFQKFGETLVPIMKKLGADPGQPQIMKVHNVKNG